MHLGPFMEGVDSLIHLHLLHVQVVVSILWRQFIHKTSSFVAGERRIHRAGHEADGFSHTWLAQQAVETGV